MSLTTSINVVDIISENALMIPLGTSPQTYPAFSTGEKWLQNLQDASTFPLVYLSRPLIERGSLLPQGNPSGDYALEVFIFAAKVRVNPPQSIIEPLLVTAKAIKRELVIRLNNDSRITVGGYTVTEISETDFLDVNACGVLLEINIKVIDKNSVCLS